MSRSLTKACLLAMRIRLYKKLMDLVLENWRMNSSKKEWGNEALISTINGAMGHTPPAH